MLMPNPYPVGEYNVDCAIKLIYQSPGNSPGCG